MSTRAISGKVSFFFLMLFLLGCEGNSCIKTSHSDPLISPSKLPLQEGLVPCVMRDQGRPACCPHTLLQVCVKGGASPEAGRALFPPVSRGKGTLECGQLTPGLNV